MLVPLLLISTLAAPPAPTVDYPAPHYPASIAGMAHTLRTGAFAAATTGYIADTNSRAASRLFYRSIYASSNGVASGTVFVYGPPFGPDILPVGAVASYLAVCGC